jgi:hypothetical protein
VCDDLGIDNEMVDVFFIRNSSFDDENIFMGMLKEEAKEYLNNTIDDMNEHDDECIITIKITRMTMDKYNNLPEYE